MLGLMSGTSADGISAALVRFHEERGRVRAELAGFLSRAYSEERRERLLRAVRGVTPSEYCRLNFEMGEWLSDAALELLRDSGVAADEVHAIGSHGHTIWHEGGNSTWQCGESAVVAERTGLCVVSDFRARDIAVGGQGAPLVPIADAMLFGAEDEWRALQNLGGIGNVTLVGPNGAGEQVLAFDTGPGCVVMDAVVGILYGGMRFDQDGALARRGQVIGRALDEALAEPYFVSAPPKSTGRELFSHAYVEEFIARCRNAAPGASREDIVATAVALTARSIADAYQRFLPSGEFEVLLSGGGARNPVLADAIAAAVAPHRVRIFDEVFFDAEAKEAVAFALLGYLHLRGRAGNLLRATGARVPRVLGKLTPA
jgi:anhydro-N-acetylmuramic acid kinase